MTTTLNPSMANTGRDRTTIVLGDLKERIENLRTDKAWHALPLSKKVMVMVEEYLEIVDKEKEQLQSQQDLAS